MNPSVACKIRVYIIKNGDRYREIGDQYLAQRSQKSKLVKIRREAKQLGFHLVPVELAYPQGRHVNKEVDLNSPTPHLLFR